MNILAQTAKTKIGEAFANAEYPGDDNLVTDGGRDPECREIAAAFSNKAWDSISTQMVREFKGALPLFYAGRISLLLAGLLARVHRFAPRGRRRLGKRHHPFDPSVEVRVLHRASRRIHGSSGRRPGLLSTVRRRRRVGGGLGASAKESSGTRPARARVLAIARRRAVVAIVDGRVSAYPPLARRSPTGRRLVAAQFAH
jgi:hypothetical protein